jgi:glycosyltransferase involved in cell wall biosynthesis
VKVLKWSIIIHRQNKEKYERCVEALSNLDIPSGYEVDLITIEGGNSRAAAYSQGMMQSNADYKVYLDENVCLLKKDFFQRIVGLFESDEALGLLGLSGAKVIPRSGIGYNSKKRCGRLIFGSTQNDIVWTEQAAGILEVLTVDGYVMVTRYDLPWRADFFTEDSFFAEAQSMEFKRKGYKVAVAGQATAWAWYTADEFPISKRAAGIFLGKYFADLFPKVLVVIPTYNRPDYLKIALESVLSQTYKNMEIVISDDSTTDESELMLQEYIRKDTRIKYYRHKGFNMTQNWAWIRRYIRESPLEYVNWLMDDDMFHPEKIARMMDYYLQEDGITLVTSYRQMIDQDGGILEDMDATKKICGTTSRFDGNAIGKKLLLELLNFIGEPTTVLIKKKYMRIGGFDWSEQNEKYNIFDFPTWLELLSQGDMIYIAEPLSYFRVHEGQAQYTSAAGLVSLICWAREIQYAYNQKIFIEKREEYGQALYILMGYIFRIFISHRFTDAEAENQEYLWKLMQEMLAVFMLPAKDLS